MRNSKDAHNENYRANQQDNYRRMEIRVESQQSGSQARTGTVGTETSVSEGQTKASIPGHIDACKCPLDLHNCGILTIMQWRENFVVGYPAINCGKLKRETQLFVYYLFLLRSLVINKAANPSFMMCH